MEKLMKILDDMDKKYQFSDEELSILEDEMNLINDKLMALEPKKEPKEVIVEEPIVE